MKTNIATVVGGPEAGLRTTQHQRTAADNGFTFTELLVTLGTIGLLMVAVLPLLASNRTSSDRAVCQSNLRQIGRAFNMWADDHRGRYPYETLVAEGGVSDHPIANNAWYQFLSLSEELGSPRVLVCPTDREKFPAKNWSNDPSGGFNHPGQRNRSVSYLVGLSTQHSPRGFLSSDRNVQHTSIAAGCFGGPIYSGIPQLDWQAPTLNWTDRLHNRTGNILVTDGSVIPAGQSELRTAVKNALNVNDSSLCVIYPN